MEQQKIAKIKQELKANYKFIKYDGLILETFATNLLKLHSSDVSKTIEYLEALSKKDITDKFISIVKDFETSNEISEIIKSSIQIENEKVKVRQAKVNVLDKETDDLLEYKEELEADLAKLKTEQEKITDDFKQICQARETIFTDKIKQLEITKTTLQDTIDGVYRNELYEDEFNIPEHEYVQSHPLVQLKDKIYTDKPKNNITLSKTNITFSNFGFNKGVGVGVVNNLSNYFWNIYNHSVVYKHDKLLQPDEYIIGIIDNYDCNEDYVGFNNSRRYKYVSNVELIYLSNYGRFIKSCRRTESNLIHMYNDCIVSSDPINTDDSRIWIINNKLHKKYINHKNLKNWQEIVATSFYGMNNHYENIDNEPGYPKPLDEARLPLLPYKMPKLFLDVINAFRNNSTDEMQICCKRYLDITRETDRKKEILTTLQFNKTIKEKDDIIARKENIIKEHSVIIDYQNEELEKLKNENAKLKKALQSFLNE